MKTGTIKSLKAATALAAAIAASSASALPLSELFFTQFAGWDSNPGNSTFNPGSSGLTGLDFTGGQVVGAPAGAQPNMNWNSAPGDVNAGNESGITIATFDDSTSPDPGKFNADFTLPDATPDEWNENEWWLITNLIQENQVLDVDSDFVPNPLWIAQTLATLSIYSDSARTDLLLEDTTTDVVTFFESPNNVGVPANCATQNPLDTLCDDVFVVDASNFDPVQFTRDGYLYTINFTLQPGPATPGPITIVCPNPLDARCASVVVPDGLVYIYTAEANPGTASVNVAMLWNAVAIPVPGIVGLLGAGVLSVGFLARRRRVSEV